MRCQRCLNEDPAYFYHGSKGWYCRKCISFQRVMIEEEMEPVSLSPVKEKAEEYELQYPLTQAQAEISLACMEHIEERDVLIHAVCGAGKTELVTGVIAKYLSEGKKVCFAIARRQVVLEVAERMKKYFRHAKVIPVCGGHTSVTDGDLIVCTTHQLYRYYRAFDLLILDEPDAFPFRGNDVLHGIASTAVKGRTVYLTATPDETLKQRVNDGTLYELVLNERPHGKPIPVPVIHTAPEIICFIILIRWLYSHDSHPRIIFVPSVHMAKKLCYQVRVFMKCTYVTSKEENRDEIIESFRNEKHGVIVATTVLERGVTIPDCDVCVYHAESPSFDEAALIQMAGRAGRNFHNPYGDVLFLCMEKSSLAYACRKQIMEANESL